MISILPEGVTVADVNRVIGQVLRICRKTRHAFAFQSKGITQADVAEALGVNQSVISKIEQGKVSLGLAEFLLLAKVLDMPAQELLQIIEEVTVLSDFGKNPLGDAIKDTFLKRVLSDKV